MCILLLFARSLVSSLVLSCSRAHVCPTHVAFLRLSLSLSRARALSISPSTPVQLAAESFAMDDAGDDDFGGAGWGSGSDIDLGDDY